MGVGVGPEDRDVLRLRPDFDSTTGSHGLVVETGVSGIAPAISDDSGNFTLDGAPAGSFSVRVSHADYRERTLSTADRWDAMCVTSRALRLMSDWIAHPIVAEYSLSSDRDGRWRTGGTVDEVVDEAGLSPRDLLAGLERFARERERRLARLADAVESARRRGPAGEIGT
jgi:transketolase